jgi:hypothetical protein
VTVPKAFAEKKLISTGEVARRMKVHRGTVWHWIKIGLLRAEKVTPRYSGVTAESLAILRKTYGQEIEAGQKSGIPKKLSVSPKKARPSRKPGKRTRRTA